MKTFLRQTLLLSLIFMLLCIPAASALTLNCPETVTYTESLRLSGTSNDTLVTLTISGGIICPSGAALEDLAVYNKKGGTTTVPVIDGQWEYTWNINGRLDPFHYNITSIDSQQNITASFLYTNT